MKSTRNNKARRVIEARQALVDHHKRVEDFYNDPATKAYHVTTEDFQEGFDVKERKLLSLLLKAATEAGDENSKKEALAGFEKWMP